MRYRIRNERELAEQLAGVYARYSGRVGKKLLDQLLESTVEVYAVVPAWEDE